MLLMLHDFSRRSIISILREKYIYCNLKIGTHVSFLTSENLYKYMYTPSLIIRAYKFRIAGHIWKIYK